MSIERYQRAFQDILHWKTEYPVLKTADACKPIEFLPKLMSGEVQEFQQELEKWGTHFYDQLETGKEWVDIWVFFTFVCERMHVFPDIQNALTRANGQATASNFFSRFQEKALSITEGNRQHNVDDFAVQLISAGNHLPTAVHLEKVVEIVINKNKRNRPPKFYARPHTEEDYLGYVNHKGQRMNVEEMLRKYDHNEKMLRTIRDHYKGFSGGQLSSWMYEPYTDLIMDYQNSETNFQILCQQLKEEDRRLQQHLFFLLKGEKPRYPYKETLPAEQFDYALFLTGTLLSIV